MQPPGQQEGNKAQGKHVMVESRLKSMTPCDGLKGSMFTFNRFHIKLYDMYLNMYVIIIYILETYMFAACINF